MPRTPGFQGARARLGRGARGVYVVHEKDFGRRTAPRRNGECLPDVFLPFRQTGAGLRKVSGAPVEHEGRERPAGDTGKGLPDERRKVEPPPEIFEGPDRYGNDRRPETGRKTVAPFPVEGFQEPLRQGVRGNGLPGVLRGQYRVADGSLVGEQRTRRVEGGELHAAGAGEERFAGAAVYRERSADGALPAVPAGPAPDGRGGQAAGGDRKERG